MIGRLIFLRPSFFNGRGEPVERPSAISQREQWDRQYSEKDYFFGREPSELARSALDLFLELGVKEVLELGCGQGRDTWYLANNGMNVCAIDYSEIGISQMKEFAKNNGCDVELMTHDAKHGLPFPDGSFDAVYSHMFFTMEFTEAEVADMLAECRRVLKSGGLNIYSVRNPADLHYGKFTKMGEDMWKNPLGFVVHFFSEDTIRRMSSGYDIIWIKEFEDGSPPFVKRLYEVALRKR
jgi:SAM-dependent methyltransferase